MNLDKPPTKWVRIALLQARQCIFVSLYNTFNNTVWQKRYMLEYINTVHTLFLEVFTLEMGQKQFI